MSPAATSPALPAGLGPGGRFDQWQAPTVAWLASDADGTLLGTDDQVTDAVAAAMVAAADAGVAVGIVTGRMRQGADRIHARLPVAGPHVLHNGAEVRLDGATLASWPLDDDAVRTLLEIARDHHAYGELYTSSTFTITRDDDRAEVHWESLGQYPAGISTLDDPPREPILKATFIGYDLHETDRLEAAFRTVGLTVGSAHSLAHPDRNYINVTAPGVTKAHAIATAAERIGIGPEQVAMIGDGRNDLPAFEIVGTAIAMGQAADEIKEAAHLVTAPVTDDGVVVALHALGLLDG